MEIHGLSRTVHGPYEVIRISVCVYVYFVINEKDIGLVRRTHITLHFTHFYINIYFIH